jgi:sulfonate transport system permease protein
MKTGFWTRLLVAPLSLAALVAFWHVVATSGFVPRAFLASPEAAWNALVRGFTRGDLRDQTLSTLWRMAAGWLLASLGGIVIGAFIGLSKRARAYVAPTLELMRPLPASAVVPVAIALVGLTPGMALAVVVFGSVWPALLATVHGFRNIEPRLAEVARCLEFPRLQFALKIGLPNALPDILSGMRLSLTVALVVTIVAEILSGQPGLGTAILQAGRSFRAPDLYAGLILLSLIGFCGNALLVVAERRLLRWRSIN